MSFYKGDLVELFHNTPAWKHGDLITDWQVARVIDFDTLSDAGIKFTRAMTLTLYVPAVDIKKFRSTTTRVTRSFDPATYDVEWTAND